MNSSIGEITDTTGPIESIVRIHPVFILGVAILLVSLGAVFAETVFITIAAAVGTTVLTGAITWTLIGVITTVLGFLRSFDTGMI